MHETALAYALAKWDMCDSPATKYITTLHLEYGWSRLRSVRYLGVPFQ